jgi:hypothetical protein
MNRNDFRAHLPLLAIGLVLAAAFSRILPHPHNFTPIGGMALFAGAVFSRNRLGWMIPFVALWLSDLVLNNTIYAHYYEGFRWLGNGATLLSFALIFLMGRLAIRDWKPMRLITLSLSGSVLFFLITNGAAWASAMSPYSKDLPGLMTCYAAGIPFFGGTVAGDLFYNTVLFGGWYLLTSRQPRLVTV